MNPSTLSPIFQKPVACLALLAVLLLLAACSGTTARVQGRDARVEQRAQPVSEQALGRIDVEATVDAFDSRSERDNYAASLRSMIQRANLFGSDSAKPYTLKVRIVGFSIPMASTAGFDSHLDVHYQLLDATGKVVYEQDIESEGRDDSGAFFGPTRQNRSRTVAVAENMRLFVQRLSPRLEQHVAALAPPAPTPVPAGAPAPASVAAGQAPQYQRPAVGLPADLPPVALSPLAVEGPMEFGRYHALVIGIDAYRHIAPLESAIADAERMAQILQQQYGFETQLMRNASRDQIVSALAEYRRKLSASDNLLIYYAGHGWVDEQADEGYWLPVDATSEDPSRWLSNATLTTTIRALPAKHVLVIADSCFSGKLTRGLNLAPRTQDYLRRLVARKSRTALTSGGLEPVLDSGGKNNHSVFASALFDVLEQNTGIVDTTQLFAVVRRQVALAADQFPEYGDIRRSGHDGGDFLFVRRAP